MTHRDPAKVGAVVGEHRVGDLPAAGRRARPAPSRSGGVRAPPRRRGARASRHARASARTASSTCTTASSIADPMGTVRRVYDVPRPRAAPRRRAGDRATGTDANRTGAHGDPPLHRRAVRAERRAAALRLRLLHPTTSTSTSKADVPTRRHDDERSDDARLPSWADQMQALERVGDNLIAKWRPDGADRGRDPGHEQARAVDPRRRLPVPRLHRRRAARCSCRCGTTRSTRAGPTPTTSTRPTEVDPTGVYRISGLPRHARASSRSPSRAST